MIKKFLATVLVFCFVMTTLQVFAEGTTNTAIQPKKTLLTDLINEVKERKEAFKTAIQYRNKLLKENEQKLDQLNKEIKAAHTALKTKIADIRKDDSLTTEQLKEKIEIMKSAMPILREVRTNFKATMGKIKEQSPIIKQGIAENNIDKTNLSFDSVIKIQESRIKILIEILATYNNLISKL